MDGKIESLLVERARTVMPSAIREICKLCEQPGMRSLAGGWPDPQTFPVERITSIINDLLAGEAGRCLQYATSEGLGGLRQWLAGWLKENDGLACSTEELLITHGSAQGMELAAKIFLEPGDVALVGLPTYFGGTGACKTFGARVVGVRVDPQDGLDCDELARKVESEQCAGRRPKLVYVIPDFDNPTGSSMPAGNRKRLVEIAEKYNLIIVEDSPYRDLYFDRPPPPPIKSFDRQGRVIFLRSFSKIFCPGFRLGLALGEAQIVRRMVIARQFEDCCTAAFSQYVLEQFCRRGFLEEQIRLNREFYRRKRDLLLELLKQHFPANVKWNRPGGGFFIWVELPAGQDAEELLQKSLGRRVAFVSGAPFFVDGSGKNTLRLSYAQASEEELRQAAADLGAVLKEMLQG
jgi:2-aminoadipate transaminase